MNYDLVKRGGCYFVAGLKEDYGDLHSDDDSDVLLIVVYDAGDCDTIKRKGDKMLRSLYDLYQTNSNLHDGDTFSLNGAVVYRCDGVHVVEA